MLPGFTSVDVRFLDRDTGVVDVYILRLNGEVVYVGRTANLTSRLFSHRNGGKWTEAKDFDEVFKLTVAASDGAAFEGALMRHFVPRYCTRVEVDARRDQEIVEWLGLEFRPGGHARLTKHRRARRQRERLRAMWQPLARAIWRESARAA